MTFFSRLLVYFSLALLMGVMVAVVLLDQYYVSAVKDEERMRTQGIQQLLQQQLTQRHAEASVSPLHRAQWQSLLEPWLAQWQDKFGYHLSLLSPADVPLPDHQQRLLRRQGLLIEASSGWVTDEVTLLYYYPDCDCVLVLEKLYHDTLAYQHYGNALVLVVFSVLGLFVGLYVRANQRHVRRLCDSYQAYGRGDFSQRADIQLPHPYSVLASQFNHMAERIETLMNEHLLMLNGVSHDLKTPLARLRFSLDMTRDCQSLDECRDKMQQMDMCLDDLSELLDDWLLLAKLNGHAYPITLVCHNLAQIVGMVVRRLQPLHEDIELTQELAQVEASIDIGLFSRVLENLLANGFKYANSQLRICLRSEAGKGFVLVIEDDGPGIADVDKERVFQPFTRLDESRSSQGGGLGLAIVANLLEKHGFDLQLQDSELGGAAFVVQGSQC